MVPRNETIQITLKLENVSKQFHLLHPLVSYPSIHSFCQYHKNHLFLFPDVNNKFGSAFSCRLIMCTLGGVNFKILLLSVGGIVVLMYTYLWTSVGTYEEKEERLVEQDSTLPLCPIIPPGLGKLSKKLNLSHIISHVYVDD